MQKGSMTRRSSLIPICLVPCSPLFPLFPVPLFPLFPVPRSQLSSMPPVSSARVPNSTVATSLHAADTSAPAADMSAPGRDASACAPVSPRSPVVTAGSGLESGRVEAGKVGGGEGDGGIGKGEGKTGEGDDGSRAKEGLWKGMGLVRCGGREAGATRKRGRVLPAWMLVVKDGGKGGEGEEMGAKGDEGRGKGETKVRGKKEKGSFDGEKKAGTKRGGEVKRGGSVKRVRRERRRTMGFKLGDDFSEEEEEEEEEEEVEGVKEEEEEREGGEEVEGDGGKGEAEEGREGNMGGEREVRDGVDVGRGEEERGRGRGRGKGRCCRRRGNEEREEDTGVGMGAKGGRKVGKGRSRRRHVSASCEEEEEKGNEEEERGGGDVYGERYERGHDVADVATDAADMDFTDDDLLALAAQVGFPPSLPLTIPLSLSPCLSSSSLPPIQVPSPFHLRSHAPSNIPLFLLPLCLPPQHAKPQSPLERDEPQTPAAMQLFAAPAMVAAAAAAATSIEAEAAADSDKAAAAAPPPRTAAPQAVDTAEPAPASPEQPSPPLWQHFFDPLPKTQVPLNITHPNQDKQQATSQQPSQQPSQTASQQQPIQQPSLGSSQHDSVYSSKRCQAVVGEPEPKPSGNSGGSSRPGPVRINDFFASLTASMHSHRRVGDGAAE
ncbi:unnamed protein product [Closterium sp. NIES-53]